MVLELFLIVVSFIFQYGPRLASFAKATTTPWLRWPTWTIHKWTFKHQRHETVIGIVNPMVSSKLVSDHSLITFACKTNCQWHRKKKERKTEKSPILIVQHDADESVECLRYSRQNKNKHRNKIIPTTRSRSTARKLYEKSHQNQFEKHTKIFST